MWAIVRDLHIAILYINHGKYSFYGNFWSYVFARPIWEGGQYAGDEKSRFEALQLAMELGADHIDIELKVPFSFKMPHYIKAVRNNFYSFIWEINFKTQQDKIFFAI